MVWKGKTAIVTGAGSGIGQAIARELGSLGMNVACCGRRQALLDETVALIREDGGKAAAWSVDVCQSKEVSTMVEEVVARWDSIDLLLNNAGRHGDIGPMWTRDPEDWWADVDVNLRGTFLCCRAVLLSMLKQDTGLIVNISGGGDVGARPFGSSYACSKAAVLRLTDSLAGEVRQTGKDNIIVLAFNPGLTRTAMTEGLFQSEDTGEWMPMFQERFRSQQVHEPSYVAKVLAKLIDAAGPSLSGRAIHISDPLDTILTEQTGLKEDALFLRRVSWE